MNNCANCGYYATSNQACMILQSKVPAEFYCTYYNSNPLTCELCGAPLIQPVVEKIGDIVHTVCLNCSKSSRSCKYCAFGTTCLFDTDPSPLPKVVQKVVRHGNMQMATQVRNPDRIEITCKKNCKCFSSDFSCLKEKGSCSNLDFKYPNI